MTRLAELVARAPISAVDRAADVLHKRRIDELVDAGGDVAAAAAYRLERVDTRPIDLPLTAVVACVVVRNEADRLPALLMHHRQLGVQRFFVVDNESTDDTQRVLAGEADVHVWSSTMPFEAANFGAAWFDVILRAHARGHWVVIVDADELLWYPDWERRSLPEVCAELDAHGHRALGAAFLDMYADTPVAHTRMPRGVSPLDTCRYFDRRWYHSITKGGGPFRNQPSLHGGVRRRVFGGRRDDYCLNKVPVLRFDLDAVLVGGQHATNLALAPTRGAVLHFKFDERLARYAQVELQRGQRTGHAGEYHAYVEALALRSELTLFDAAESIELTGGAQLVELGVMGRVEDLDHASMRAQAYTRLAETKAASAGRRRAIAYLWRAADASPTSVGPLLRIAQKSCDVDGGAETAGAIDEAIARDPDNLSLLEIRARSAATREASECEPSGEHWVAAVRALAPFRERGGVVFDACVDATFGWADPLRYERRVHTTPWVGCVHGVPRPPTHLATFARHGLAALWESPELLRSLEHCRGLFTFSEHAGNWLRAHTDLPVSVVPPPFEAPEARFDLERFIQAPERELVQLGWWMTRLNSICDLPVAAGNALGLRKFRAAPAERHRMALALARAERAHDGWGETWPLLATTDVGGLTPSGRAHVLRSAVIFADLYDANADPVVVDCIASTTPILVNRHPAVVEHLGPDYPLYFDSLNEAATKVIDSDTIEAAHRHLCTDEVRRRATPDVLLRAICDSDVFAGLT
ncbi:MAG TPA: glycosyltransferase family 2 protein [Aeromicrobium sp.]|nr:glycosyltransferase family 2 protein [Aeromicrobium sp.]